MEPKVVHPPREGDVPNALSALIARAKDLGGGAAPVERWDPPDCGPIPMRIDAGGTWHYAGSPIRREALTFLFARILRREPDGHFVLVTPHEKVTIEVEDAPFIAPEFAVENPGEGQTIVARTNVGDVVRAGADHPLRFAIEKGTGGMVPYVHVRGGLEARFTRAAAFDLADVIVESQESAGVWSGGTFFEAV